MKAYNTYRHVKNTEADMCVLWIADKGDCVEALVIWAMRHHEAAVADKVTIKKSDFGNWNNINVLKAEG